MDCMITALVTLKAMTVGADGREQVSAGRLARLGFGDLDRARRLLATQSWHRSPRSPDILAALEPPPTRWRHCLAW